MARKLPPLTTLPAFDAAARLLSFTEAAAELNVTHGAISRAVHHLEEVLGVGLFERGTRSVSLTAEGATYAAEVGTALDRIGVATMATAVSKIVRRSQCQYIRRLRRSVARAALASRSSRNRCAPFDNRHAD